MKKYLITFKKKDKREDLDKDKSEILKSRVKNVNIESDMNEYEAPILTVEMEESEVDEAKKDNNIESIEEDVPMFALDGFNYSDSDNFNIESIPNLENETIPQGLLQIKADKAWAYGTGKGIKVAVLDTGIDANHPDLKNVKGGASFIQDEESWDDFNGHGTHCAGTIGATSTGSGIVGVAPECELYAVKCLNRYGSGMSSEIVKAINWSIENKMDIISMSLGASWAPQAIKRALHAAFKKGITIVAASGNSSSSVSYPAAWGECIAVGAIDSNNRVASFSNYGSQIELGAPGVNILSCAPGGGYTRLSGTSMACPHVAGVAALAMSTHRFAVRQQIRWLLRRTADDIGDEGVDRYFGYGRVDAKEAASAFKIPSRQQWADSADIEDLDAE